MKLNLSFVRKHQSIESLENVTLPSFAVVTGVNGAGKTHLLEAIKNGSIAVEGVPNLGDNIVLFNRETFVPNIQLEAAPAHMQRQRVQAIKDSINNQKAAVSELANYFVSHNIIGDSLLFDGNFLLVATPEKLSELLKPATRKKGISHDDKELLVKNFFLHKRRLEQNFISTLGNNGKYSERLNKRAGDLKQSILALNESVLVEELPLDWTSGLTLNAQIAAWFVAWHAAFEANKIARYYAKIEGQDLQHHTDEEFRLAYGIEPWFVLNDVLATIGIRYRFNNPDFKLNDLERTFNLKLEDVEDKRSILVNALSTGEKVLLAIVILLYQTQDGLEVAKKPKMLLLDEVDACLHPAFTKVLLEMLLKHIVEKCGIPVILATHSPSTVALAPKDSVFELSRKPRLLRPLAPSQAAQVLSSGFVAITSTDIVVLTEGDDDAVYYQRIHSSILKRGGLGEGPMLKFIAASQQANIGVGGGVHAVKNWAPKLHELGLERFKGLIDRDTGNQEDSVIKVIRRHSLENYLMDPLLLSAFLIHRGIVEPFGGVELNRLSSLELISLDQNGLQKLVDAFCAWLSEVEKNPAIASDVKETVSYLGFPGVMVSRWWVDSRGHDLETILRKRINPLGVQQGRGALLKEGLSELMDFQCLTLPELISQDFVQLFDALRR